MFAKLKNRWLQLSACLGLFLMLWMVGVGAFHTHAITQVVQSEYCNLCIVGQQLGHSLQTVQQPLLLHAQPSFLVSVNNISFFPAIIISTNLSRAPPQFI